MHVPELPPWCGRLIPRLRAGLRGGLDAGHHSLAVLGLLVLALLALTVGRAEVRHEIEVRAMQWLQDRTSRAATPR